MKNFITLGLITIGLFGLSNTSKAQTKLGYVSPDEIIILMPEAAKVDTQLNQYQQALYQSAQEQQTAFNEAVAKFYKDSVTMTASVKEVKRGELQKQVADLSGAEQRIQQQMQQKQQEYLAPIQKKLFTAIQDVAKENGYAYIFTREALLIMPPADDIAPLVKKKLGIKATTTAAPKTTPAK
ncbi:MAG TPA: OmpH family outer membrane protein [Chitinophagaceae bacterium]|nr:OmpH family outer membrane protein [Chitinophagaceae bacterium]